MRRQTRKVATAEFELPESLRDVVNVAKEEGKMAKRLQQISDENKAILLAFIAPYGAVRISPVEERGASIRFVEEWSMEYALSLIRGECSTIGKLYLLVNSPGGIPASCYNIAYMLQTCFSEIKTFVPQMALSGGTLLALTGNQIVMGLVSRFSPIDVQVPHGDGHVSAYAMSRALSRLDDYFKTKRAEEAPYPWCSMADKLDPVKLEDWTTALLEIAGYAEEILKRAKYPEEKRKSIVRALALTDKTHSYVIHRDRASEIGLNVSKDTNDGAILNEMRHWLAEYVFEKEMTHTIRYIIPKLAKLTGLLDMILCGETPNWSSSSSSLWEEISKPQPSPSRSSTMPGWGLAFSA